MNLLEWNSFEETLAEIIETWGFSRFAELPVSRWGPEWTYVAQTIFSSGELGLYAGSLYSYEHNAKGFYCFRVEINLLGKIMIVDPVTYTTWRKEWRAGNFENWEVGIRPAHAIGWENMPESPRQQLVKIFDKYAMEKKLWESAHIF
jgi:hypothetical protein